MAVIHEKGLYQVGKKIIIIYFNDCSNLLCWNRGRIKHTEVCQLLRQMVPPVGIGMKCPKIVAYKVGCILVTIAIVDSKLKKW